VFVSGRIQHRRLKDIPRLKILFWLAFASRLSVRYAHLILQCAALIAARYEKESQRDMKKKKISEQLSRNETKVFHHVLDKRRYLDFNFAFFETASVSSKKFNNQKASRSLTNDHIWEDVL
jgi:hypothetical protein